MYSDVRGFAHETNATVGQGYITAPGVETAKGPPRTASFVRCVLPV